MCTILGHVTIELYCVDISFMTSRRNEQIVIKRAVVSTYIFVRPQSYLFFFSPW